MGSEKKFITFLIILLCCVLFSSGTVDLENLFNYANQEIPVYITKDNSPENNSVDDAKATLGRVLFYDKNLSANNTIACASCHKQEFAFGDTARISRGLNGGGTARHTMRLINIRFGEEPFFFWNERANSLEAQATMPIQDSIEMGFSGFNAQPSFDSLIFKLEALSYYEDLFILAFGTPDISESKIQLALANFLRSIQSFDSRFDEGLTQVDSLFDDFPNFTVQENMGKRIFLGMEGGATCHSCHRPPEFDIVPDSGNNGVVTVAGDTTAIDILNARSPTLRDLMNPDGLLNGPLMHDGSFTSLLEVVDHYSSLDVNPINNPILDMRLFNTKPGQTHMLTMSQKEDLIAFLGTLTGTNVYIDEKWSDPFDEDGSLTICATSTLEEADRDQFKPRIFPNPVTNLLNVQGEDIGNSKLVVYDAMGKIRIVEQIELGNNLHQISVDELESGIYFLIGIDKNEELVFYHKLIKEKL